MKRVYVIFFLIIVAGELSGAFFQLKWMDYVFKPLIMVWIASWFLLNSKELNKKVVQLAVAAFLFSWIGDIFLMFGDDGFIYFMFGLVSFFLAQVSYIFLFRIAINFPEEKSFISKYPGWFTFYFLYGLSVYILLFSHLDLVLKFAVFIYMLALITMSVMALNRFGNVSLLSFNLVFSGSVLFVISDTLLAINKFVVDIPFDRILVMSSYIAAQYLIMNGLLKIENKNPGI